MSSCIQSAKANYEQRGLEPDRDAITKLCMCTGQEIESKYDYDASSKISPEEMKNIMIEVTKKCASEN